MVRIRQAPIFCDNCSTLAFANIDGAVLCAQCLEKELKLHVGNKGRANIEPLEFVPSPTKRSVERDTSEFEIV
jgi:uncharacterized Zn finger protein (UPF0148 family)